MDTSGEVVETPVDPNPATITMRALEHALNYMGIDNAMQVPDFELARKIFERAKVYDLGIIPPEVPPTEAEKLAQYVTEVDDSEGALRYRLMHTPSGRTTAWATYRETVVLDDIGAAGPYYLGGDSFEVMPIAQLLKVISVGEAPRAPEA